MSFKLRMLALLILTMGFSGAARAGGSVVGNGGDILRCKPDSSSPFNGYFLLDYVATFDHSSNNSDIILDDPRPLQTVARVLQQKVPKLGSALQSFILDLEAQYLGKPDYLRQHIWIGQRLGLGELSDEYLVQKIPENCYMNFEKRQLDLTQAVVREERPTATLYRYDELQVRELKRQSELQFSFLIVHEWLWYYSPNANVVRDVNRFLHSKDFQAKSAVEVFRILQNLGMDVDRQPPLKTFDVTLDQCDPRLLTPVEIHAPKGNAVNIQFHNTTECGFAIFAKPGPVFRILEVRPNYYADPEPLEVKAPVELEVLLSPMYADRFGIPYDPHDPPRIIGVKVVED